MRARLVEIDFIFMAAQPGGGHGNRITVRAGLLRRKLYLSFSLGGPADARGTLPAALVDAIRAGLDYAAKHVRAQDLVEEDSEPDDG